MQQIPCNKLTERLKNKFVKYGVYPKCPRPMPGLSRRFLAFLAASEVTISREIKKRTSHRYMVK
jgi:hypothetical protein